MNPESLILELFCRRRLDRSCAPAALTFLLDYSNGAFEPEECGVYDPYEPFRRAGFDHYVDWLTRPGGEFGFRGRASSFAVEGHILNMLFPEILMEDKGTPRTRVPDVTPPAYSSRWRLRFEPLPQSEPDLQFVRGFFVAAARASGADYGFVAHAADYKAKNFSSVRKGQSVVEQYVGDDAELGIPGLYWLNFFGDMYVRFFGEGRIVSLAQVMSIATTADSGFHLQFGRDPEDSLTKKFQEREQQAALALGELAFFDIRRASRVLSVPPELSRKS
jgi:hypothetical protein